MGIPESPEPHATFVENALEKARHAARLGQGAALADDSGLCVDALQGAPGVLSARYATLFGQDKSDASNNQVLLEKLAQWPDASQRSARFISILVAVRHAQDPEPLIAMGRWNGQILTQLKGEGGFGYDPLMWIPELGKSVAELSPQEKNSHSHRAKASAQLLQLMKDVWHLG